MGQTRGCDGPVKLREGGVGVEVEGLLQADFEDERGDAGPSLGPATGLRFLNASGFVGSIRIAKLDEGSLDWHHDGQTWSSLRVSSLE